MPPRGYKLSEETKQRMSEAKKGNTNCLGRVISEESRKKMSDSKKALIKSNPEFLSKALAANKVRQDKLRQSPEEKAMKSRLRSSYKHLLERLLSHKGVRKINKSEEYLGYTQKQFNVHIESLLTDELRKSGFEIDHKIPVAVFIKKGVLEPKIVNALSNLQPMSSRDNKVKSDNYEINNFEKDLEEIMKGILK